MKKEKKIQPNHEDDIFKDFFKSLPKYDHIDHIGKLARYLHPKSLSEGVDESNRLTSVFRKMLVQMVAGALSNSPNRNFMILAGSPGIGKNIFLSWLMDAGLPFKTSFELDTSMAGQVQMIDLFCIHMRKINKLTETGLKNLCKQISKEKLKIISPNDSKAEPMNRRCNFIGSSDNLEFLSLWESVNRMQCLYLNDIDWSYRTEIDVLDIWSQAYYLFKNSGFIYQFNRTEVLLNRLANGAYYSYYTEMNHKQLMQI